jgi:hypothetical protein
MPFQLLQHMHFPPTIPAQISWNHNKSFKKKISIVWLELGEFLEIRYLYVGID